MHTYQKYRPAWQQLLLFGTLTIGFFVISLTVGALIIFVFYDVPRLDLSQMDFSNPKLLPALKVVQVVSAILMFLVPSLLFAYLSDRQPKNYLGLRPPSPRAFILISILLILLSFPLVGWLSELNHHLHLPKGLEGAEKMLKEAETKNNNMIRSLLNMKSPGDLLIMLFVLGIVPAVAEELFFRGVLQRIFIQMTKRPWLGITISAIIFSALHGQFLGFFPRMVLGMLLGALYWYSGSLFPAILAHFFNNAVQVILVYFRPDLLDKEPNFTAGLVAASTFLVIGAIWWMKRISQTRYVEVYDTDDDFHIGPRDQYIA